MAFSFKLLLLVVFFFFVVTALNGWLVCAGWHFFSTFLSSNSCCSWCYFLKIIPLKKRKNNKHAFHRISMHNRTYESVNTRRRRKKSNYNNNVKSIRCFTFLLRMIIAYCAPLHAIRVPRYNYCRFSSFHWSFRSPSAFCSISFLLAQSKILKHEMVIAHKLCRLCCSNSINLINRF